ncbi:MAG: cellulase family glycosylhydrolase [Candidatus Heimdallarchaeota archaeon]|nr:cellulase family glycosylhydrolase [Candidatus Heimdallarchaeota archaeon]
MIDNQNKKITCLIIIGLFFLLQLSVRQPSELTQETLNCLEPTSPITISKPQQNASFIEVEGNKLIKNGEPLYLVGANHADLIWSFIWPQEIAENGVEVLEQAAAYNITVLRYSAIGYYDWQLTTWEEQKAFFWTKYDEMIGHAKDLGLYLIPTILWNPEQFGNKVGEEPWDVVFTGTTANNLFRNFVNELVLRYRNESCILMWEIGNELNLLVEPRTNYYSITELRTFLSRTVQLIRSLDSNHLIGSGMAGAPFDINPTMDDALEHFETVNDFGDVASLHTYPNDQTGTLYGISEEAYLQQFQEKAAEMDKPLMIGEFGDNLKQNENSEFVLEVLATSFKRKISLALIWEWLVPSNCDYNRQQFNVHPLITPFITRITQQYAILSLTRGLTIKPTSIQVEGSFTKILYETIKENIPHEFIAVSNSTIFIQCIEEFPEENLTIVISGVKAWNNYKSGLLNLTIPKSLLPVNLTVLIDGKQTPAIIKGNETCHHLSIAYKYNNHILQLVNTNLYPKPTTEPLTSGVKNYNILSWGLSLLIIVLVFRKHLEKKNK